MALCLRNLWFNWGSGLGFSPHMVHDTQSQKNWCPCLASLSTRHTWCTDIHAGKHLLHKIKTYDKSVFKRKRAIDVATRQILGPIRTFLDLGQPTGLTVSFYPLFMEWGDCLSLSLSLSQTGKQIVKLSHYGLIEWLCWEADFGLQYFLFLMNMDPFE